MNGWPEPTSDEKLLAGLSHLLGFWVALIVWFFQREKSGYVRFQALQAIAYSLLLWALGLLVGLAFVFAFFGVMILITVTAAAAVETGDPSAWLLLPMMMPFIAATIFVPLALITWAPRLIAVVQTLQGKNFRYPWLAGLVERFEGNEK